MRCLSTLLPFQNRSIASDRIIKVLTLSLLLGLLSSIGSMAPAQAVLVTATGTNPTICNQEVSSSDNVVAYRLSGGDCVIEFKNVGTVNWTVPTRVTAVQVLTVGGGGGGGGGSRASQDGGRGGGGGGEGGEVKYSASYSLSGGSTASVVVGGGGASGTFNNNSGGFGSVGSPGGASTFNGANSAAGGAGGGVMTAQNTFESGGNGGGLLGSCNSSTVQSFVGSANNYYAGCNDWEGGGGGAGAGANGGNGTDIGGAGGNGGAGGVGLSYSITDAATFFGGGGGGGGTSGSVSSLSGSAGAGGNGGGGGGSIYGSPSPATSGTANRGGGGGGGGGYSNATQVATSGGTGGSGIVIVRFTPDSTAPTYSSSSISSDGLSLTLTYNESLSATTAAPANFVVTVNSTETRTISTVSISGSSVTLALGARIESGQSIAITYTDPTGGNDANAVQDLWGNDASTLSNQSITNTSNSTNDSAINLNGSSQYAAATSDVSGFDIANAITLEAWIYPTGASCNGNIAGKATSYFMYCVNGTLAYAMGGASSWSGVSTGITIPTNEWHHVAFTRAASTASANVYFNGNLVYSGTADGAGASALTDSGAPNLFNIGARNGSTTFFTGRIDEVKLWNVARTQAQVQSDLKTYGGSLSDGLVAYYDFNDQSGATLMNRSTGGSSALDLTLFNSPALTSAEIFETSTVQAYTVVKFMRSFLVAGAGWLSPAAPKRIQYFVVGGGGGGGNNVGGGGAGGGNYKVTNSSLLTNTRVSITVGVGGYGGLYSAGSLTVDGTTRMDGQNGDSSTVTVGANTYIGGGGSGGQTYWSTNFCGGSGVPSTYSTAGSFSGTGGIGTSGGLGGSPSGTSSVANGKTGYADSITGTSSFYGAGGGAGFWTGDGGKVAGTGANSIAGNGGSANGVVGASATKNTGAGGGGGGSGCAMGGRGSSGIVVLRYITNDPSITTQPTSDTTTVGTVDTLTVGTTSLPTPLTKSVTWQFTSETTTAAASATWQNVALGTGLNTDTYTTQVLTIGMNKYRYRAIVTFTDIDSLTVIETTTVVTLTVNPAITITSDTSTITRKYGDAQSARTIVYSGGTTNTGAVGTSTSHTVRGQVGNLASGRIYVDTSTSTAVFRVDTRTAVGTYVETITVTDAKGATASYAQRVVVTAGDTLTVQADTLTTMTYSPSGLVISPTTTLTGLVSGDTRDSLTFTYSSKNVTCANGGTCEVGNTGPGGGIVFYSVNGNYLEAAPAAWFGTATDTRTVWGCSGSTYASAYATAIGTGKANTDQIVSNCGDPTSSVAAKIARAYTGGGKSDWSLPSRDELIELCKYARTQTTGNISTSCTTSGTLNAGVLKGFGNADGNSQYWSSSDASTNNAYTVWLDGSVSGGFGGKAVNRYIRPVRYFTSDSQVLPASQSYGPTTTPPTNAGTYTVTPSNLTLTSGILTSNYASINYLSSDFTINKASQDALTITSNLASYNGGISTMKLTTAGGSDTGTVTYTVVSGGSASGCSVSTNVLSFSSVGTCRLTATKAATLNYLIAYSDTVTITLSAFVSSQQVQTQSVPTQLPISGANSLETTTVTAALLTITNVVTISSGSYTVTGTGFTNVSIVRIGGTDLVLNTNYTVPSATTISITNADGLVGPLFISLSDGQQVVRFEFPS